MINEISLNSNNAIEMSRGELLAWLNELLKLNIIKIQQLGNGAIYCQLLDVLYPNKVPLSKVNWKAKFDYEYVNNFKVLQQCFTKLNIMKHIEVQKLVKCKYQDNLQFLQWFKKMFDNRGAGNNEYDASSRRSSEFQLPQKQKIKRAPSISNSSSNQASSILGSIMNDQRFNIGNLEKVQSKQHSSYATSRVEESMKISKSHTERPQPQVFQENLTSSNANIKNVQIKQYESKLAKKDDKYRQQIQAQFQQKLQTEREFYLKKFKQIEQLMDKWDHKRGSEQLVKNIRQIMFVTPQIQWEVDSQLCQFKIKGGAHIENEEQKEVLKTSGKLCEQIQQQKNKNQIPKLQKEPIIQIQEQNQDRTPSQIPQQSSIQV